MLVPFKRPPDNARCAYTAARYNRPFDLAEIAERVGYPLFMKPYDGGQWVGVTRIRNEAELHRAYDASGERLMHLQAAIDGYDVFARSLSIGPETMVMHFRPEGRCTIATRCHTTSSRPRSARRSSTISRLINAFFRWEFNSCECLVRGDEVFPIDYANACPDVGADEPALLLPVGDQDAREVVRVLRGHRAARPQLDLDTRALFRRRRPRRALLRRRSSPPTAGWPTTTSRPSATRSSARPAWPTSTSSCSTGSPRPSSTRLLVDTVRKLYPAHEHDRFVAHFRGLVGQWVREQGAEPALSG